MYASTSLLATYLSNAFSVRSQDFTTISPSKSLVLWTQKIFPLFVATTIVVCDASVKKFNISKPLNISPSGCVCTVTCGAFADGKYTLLSPGLPTRIFINRFMLVSYTHPASVPRGSFFTARRSAWLSCCSFLEVVVLQPFGCTNGTAFMASSVIGSALSCVLFSISRFELFVCPFFHFSHSV